MYRQYVTNCNTMKYSAKEPCYLETFYNVLEIKDADTKVVKHAFSKEEKEKPGRLYVGIMPSGHTNTTALVHSAPASLLIELG